MTLSHWPQWEPSDVAVDAPSDGRRNRLDEGQCHQQGQVRPGSELGGLGRRLLPPLPQGLHAWEPTHGEAGHAGGRAGRRPHPCQPRWLGRSERHGCAMDDVQHTHAT
eukprot:scaffold336251_cov27-Prasinocladus_malaysianus.AAC.1